MGWEERATNCLLLYDTAFNWVHTQNWLSRILDNMCLQKRQSQQIHPRLFSFAVLLLWIMMGKMRSIVNTKEKAMQARFKQLFWYWDEGLAPFGSLSTCQSPWSRSLSNRGEGGNASNMNNPENQSYLYFLETCSQQSLLLKRYLAEFCLNSTFFL